MLKNNRVLVRRWIVLAAATLLIIYAARTYTSMPTTLSVAVGPAGSEREAFLNALAKSLSEGRKPIRLRVIPVKDTMEATRQLDEDKVNLAVVRSDEAGSADARSMAILARRAVVLIARGEPSSSSPPPGAEADAQSPFPEALTPSQLRGKRIVVGSDAMGSNRKLIARLLAHSGLGENAIALSEHPVARVPSLLGSGQADAAALLIDLGAPSTRALLAEISATFAGKMVLGPPASAEGLAALYRDLSLVNLPAGIFGGEQPLPARKLTTVAVTEELIGDSDISDGVGWQLSRALLESRARLIGHSTGFDIEMPPSESTRRYMAHGGITSGEKAPSFLETYSEQIWLGLFAAGLIGSSLAGLAGWLGLKRNVPPDPVRGELQRLLREIGETQSLEQLEPLRRKLRETASARLVETIHAKGALDPSHPTHWYLLADTLIAKRREELESNER